MELKRTAIRLLAIGAVPAVLMIGAAVPAAAHEGGPRTSSACQPHRWASYAEYRDYYEKHCADDGDRVKHDDDDDADENDDRDHKRKADSDKQDNDKQDNDKHDGGGRDDGDAEDAADGHDRDSGDEA